MVEDFNGKTVGLLLKATENIENAQKDIWTKVDNIKDLCYKIGNEVSGLTIRMTQLENEVSKVRKELSDEKTHTVEQRETCQMTIDKKMFKYFSISLTITFILITLAGAVIGYLATDNQYDKHNPRTEVQS